MRFELIHNATLLVAVSALYTLFVQYTPLTPVLRKGGLGLLFGGVAIIAMILPYHYAPGIIFDGRTIILAVAGLFGGWMVGGISALLAVLYRLYLGGVGTITGCGIIITSVVIGCLYRARLADHPEKAGFWGYVLLGGVVHCLMLLWMLTLPWPLGIAVIQQIGPVILLVYPLVTALLGILLGREEQRLSIVGQLAKQKELLAAAQSIGQIGSWEFDFQTDCLRWSEQTFYIFGLDPEKAPLSYNEFLKSVHPDDRDSVDTAYRQSVKNDADGYEIRHRIVLPGSDEVRVVYEKCVHRRDSQGRIETSTGLVQDITEREAMERALSRSEAKFRLAFEETPDAVSIARLRDGVYLEINQGFTDITGYLPDDILGNTSAEIGLWVNPEERSEAFAILQEKGRISNFVAEICCKDGNTKVCASSASRITLDEEPCILSISRDITDQKSIEEDLRRFNAAMVDRELRMIQLKEEVNDCRAKLELPAKYSLVT